MKKLFPLIALMCIFVLQGCPTPGPEPETDTLTAIKSEYTIEASGGELSLQFKTNLVWKAKSDASWLTVTNPTKAVTTETVKVVAQENKSTEARKANVTIEAGTLSTTIVVNQKGMTPSIVINGTTFNVSAQGGTVDVDVTSNVDYTVTFAADWVTRNGNTYTVKPNDTTKERSVVITYSYGDTSSAVVIKQSGRNEYTVSVNPTSIEAEAAGGTFNFTVTSDGNYTMQELSADWVHVSGQTVTVDENTSSSARNTTIVFTVDNSRAELKINQKGKEGPYITVTPANFSISAAAATVTLTISSNVNYDTAISATWVTDAGNGSFNVAENTSDDARTATITFSYGTISKVVTINQAGKSDVPQPEDPVLVNGNSATYEVAAAGETIEVIIRSNVEYQVDNPASWITEVSSKAATDHTHYFKVEPNTSEDERIATISFVYTTSDGTLTCTVTVKQAGDSGFEEPFIEVSPKNNTFEAAGGDFTVNVNANYEYVFSSSDSWIHVTKNGNTCNVTVDENTDSKGRSGKIKFRIDGEEVFDEFMVYQAGAAIISDDPFDVSAHDNNLSWNGTANCYVVTKAGTYTFDGSVMGNGADGYPWIGSGDYFNLWPISPEGTSFFDSSNRNKKFEKVEILWDDNNVISNLSLNKETLQVTIEVSANKGNALIAAMSTNGIVRWSWHIWCTDSPEMTTIEGMEHQGEDEVYVDYVLLDRNVGATSCDPADGEKTYGFWYQFGRKDPLKLYYGIFSTGAMLPATKSMEGSVNNPTKMYGMNTKTCEWFNNGLSTLSTVCADLWGNPQWTLCSTSNTHPAEAKSSELKKTIYDPCPPGFMVPPATTWNLVNKRRDVRIVDQGVYIYDSFYPFAGYGAISNEGKGENGWYGYYYDSVTGSGFHDDKGQGRHDRIMQVWTNTTGKFSYWIPNSSHPYVHAPDMYGAINISTMLWLSNMDDVNDQMYFEYDYSHVRQRAIPVRCMRVPGTY